VLGALGVAESHALKAQTAIDHLDQALAGLDDITLRPDLVLAYVIALSSYPESSRAAFGLLEQLSERSRGDRGLRERVDAQLIRAARFDPALYPAARQRWDSISHEDGDDPIAAATLVAAGAFEEACRGISRERAVAPARRAAATSFADADERISLIQAPYALMLAGCFDEAAGALAEFIDQSRWAGDRLAVRACFLWAGRLHAARGELLAAESALVLPRSCRPPSSR
jgi:hypothetical protein